MPDKPHISPSQMSMYWRCGEQYRRRYMEGERIPPGIALLVGTGVHCGAETNFTQKIESHADLPATDIMDAAVAGFDARSQGDGYLLSDEEAGRGANAVLGAARDQVAALTKCHAAEQAPEYQPVEVEHSTRILFPDATHDMLAITDLRDDLGRVTDIKTAARKKQQAEADTSIQLTIYAAAYEVDHGGPPAEVRLDVLTKTKTPARQLLVSDRSPADFAALIHRVNATLAGITAGIFTPAAPEDWVCSPRWCGYWTSCRYVNSERKERSK